MRIDDVTKERELNLRLHKNQGELDFELLASFDQEMLSDVGFSSEDFDDIFAMDPTPEQFDLKKELAKLDIKEVAVKPGDVYEIDGSRLMCGDSTIEADRLKLMDGAKADMIMTDPPYILDYLRGKSKQKTTGVDVRHYAKYLLREGTVEEKRQILQHLRG